MPEKKNDNTVFIGSKPVMNYVLAVVTQFNNNAGEVTIKARGRTISKAVDVAEITRNRFIKTANVGTISIGTEKLTGESGETNVSTIEIPMKSNV
ncbi:DNA-binding protein Alba [Candidatus Undinarchaeota archaeon]